MTPWLALATFTLLALAAAVFRLALTDMQEDLDAERLDAAMALARAAEAARVGRRVVTEMQVSLEAEQRCAAAARAEAAEAVRACRRLVDEAAERSEAAVACAEAKSRQLAMNALASDGQAMEHLATIRDLEARAGLLEAERDAVKARAADISAKSQSENASWDKFCEELVHKANIYNHQRATLRAEADRLAQHAVGLERDLAITQADRDASTATVARLTAELTAARVRLARPKRLGGRRGEKAA